MIDIEKLKALAEAAKEDWYNWWTLQQLESRAVDGAGAELIVAANPAAVLELIAEIERLRGVLSFEDAVACVFDSLKFAAANTGSKDWDDQLEDLAEEVIEYAPRYKKQWKDICEISKERDQLKAENEAFMKFMAEISQESGDNYAVMRARQFLKVPGYE